MITDIDHASILDRRDIESFLDYYDGLVADAANDDYTDIERIEFQYPLDEYDKVHVLQLRAMVSDSRDDSFINEGYMAEYAREYADEVFGLDGTGASEYFDYEKYADNFIVDYTSWEYDGVTYYSRD